MEAVTIMAPQICGSPGKLSHHNNGDHLLVFEGGQFSYVAVPPLTSSFTDQVKLCFADHNSEKWDPREEDCCLREGGHVHAHVHHGEITEDVLLEQCLDEAGCALPMPWDLRSTCLNETSHDQDHEHREGCGHNQIAHGDHFDWLVPMSDGSFMLSHAQAMDDGESHFIEHGRLVKVGESSGRLKMHQKQLFDLFGYESPNSKGYESLPQFDEGSKGSKLDSPKVTHLLKDDSCTPLLPSETGKSLVSDDVEVTITGNFGGHALQKTTLDVLGICCPSEVPLVKKILETLPGVQKVSVNVASKTVIVLHDPIATSDGQLVKVLNEARLEASIHRRGEWKTLNKWPSPYTICSGLLVAVAFFHYIFSPLKWVALGAVAVGIPPIIMRSFVSLQRYILDINVLMLIAVAGALGLGDFLEAGSIVFLFTLADWLESRSSDKARLAISAVMNLAPQSAVLADSGLKVPVEQIKVGTLLSVKAGELIPIDGIVSSGKSSVDESSLTGESVPIEKEPGATVWAGTMNMSGYLSVEATALAENSAVARMVRLVEEAQIQRSHTEQLVERLAKYYTPVVVVAAVALATVPFVVHVQNFRHWLYLALVLLVVACPCALVISTPVTTTCGIAQAARIGLFIKGGRFLEALGKLKVVALDKTGTLTEGHFRVADVVPLHKGTNLHQILYWISNIESKSSHPMASALVTYAGLHGLEPSGKVEGFKILPGEGVSGIVDGCLIHIGNHRLATRLGWIEAADPLVLESWSNQGATICWIGVDERPLGVFSVADQVRPEAIEAIHSMKKLGLRIAMLTGDSMDAANVVHRELGEMDVHAQLFPKDKVQVLQELKSIGMTGMVGDGINDAPALAAADVGIAMGVAGSAVAMETADIALMTNDLRKLAAAVRLGQKTRVKIQQNVVLSFATKALIIALAAAGHASLWAAVVADVGTCLAVIFNSMLLLDRKKARATSREGNCHSHNTNGKTHSHHHRHHHHHHHKLKKCIEGEDWCTKSASKLADVSTCSKSKRDSNGELARPQVPAHGDCCTAGAGRCFGNNQDQQLHTEDFSVAKGFCDMGGNTSSRGIRRRLGHKENCAKDCQGLDCFSLVAIPEEIDPIVAALSLSPDHIGHCNEASNTSLQDSHLKLSEVEGDVNLSIQWCCGNLRGAGRNQDTTFSLSHCSLEIENGKELSRSSQKLEPMKKKSKRFGPEEMCGKDCQKVECIVKENDSVNSITQFGVVNIEPCCGDRHCCCCQN